MIEYAELHCHSYFSLLDGASSPEELVWQAKHLGLRGLALTDHDNLSGAIRFWKAAQKAELHAIVGAEITLTDSKSTTEQHLTLLAETQQGYANLCQLLTASRMKQLPAGTDTDPGQWPGKVAPRLNWEQLDANATGLIALSGCRQGPVAAPLLLGQHDEAHAAAQTLKEIFGSNHFFIELQQQGLPDDRQLLEALLRVAWHHRIPAVATNNVHYATIEKAALRDVLLAIRHNQSLAEMSQNGNLPWNSQSALASPTQMVHRFSHLPDAVCRSTEIAERCQVSLDFSAQRLPDFQPPADIRGKSPFEILYELCHKALYQRYPQLAPRILKQMTHELDIIEKADLASFFLIVWGIVKFAQKEGILYQGRGSAANSIVTYLLEITPVDPLAHNLLFERFLTEDRFTMPDIDIDFQADRREEVIQYVYNHYGRAHTAMACNVVTYRARSAIREVAKALGFPMEVIDRLAKGLDTHSCQSAADQLLAQMESQIDDAPDKPPHPIKLLAQLVSQMEGIPRHLSIHSGGMLITAQPIDHLVPLEPATMENRVIVQWDKDSIEDAGLIKIDLLGLRSLSLVAEALTHIAESSGQQPELRNIGVEDEAIYDLLQRGNTLGIFQVESPAQQQMLPRLKPRNLTDLAAEVAIVRPGPIQGGAVHPYLRRRAGREPVTYLHESLEEVLGDTLGVLLYQEQAIQVAMTSADFSAGEADMLRRALNRSRSVEAMAQLRDRFLRGAQVKGIDPETALLIFDQLAGFAGYGFCRSHATSFALISYQTAWLKHYHPASFFCALFNQRPGFFPIRTLTSDARRHGIDVLPPDVNRSEWVYSLEKRSTENKQAKKQAIRTGFMAVNGVGEEGWKQLQTARVKGPFTDLHDFCARAQLPEPALQNLIRAGALDRFGHRRELLWSLGAIRIDDGALDLPPAEPATELSAELPDLSHLEQAAWEHELLGFAPDGQILEHFRPQLRAAGVYSIWQVKQARLGQRVWTAGMIAVQQRPSTAKGMTFILIEDESGTLQLAVKPDTYVHLRAVLRHETLILAGGMVQREGRVVSLLVFNASALAHNLRP